MAGAWCGECGAGMVRNGTRQVSWRDLDGGRGTERQTQVQRLGCRRCDTVAYIGAPLLSPGFRVSPQLATAVAAECLHQGFSAVARTFGLEPRTVRSLWSARLAGLAERMGHPAVCSLSMADIGSKRVALVRNLETGRMAAAFGSPASNGFRNWIGAHPGGLLVADWQLAGAAASSAPDGLHVACDRTSVLDWFEGSLAGFGRRAREWMEPRERRVLRGIWEALGVLEPERTAAQDTAIAAAAAGHPVIGEFVAGIDGFRSVMERAGAEHAAAAASRWRTGLSDFGKAVFSPVLRMLERGWSGLFGAAWSLPPARAGFPADPAFGAVIGPRDSAERTAQKMVVANAPGMAAALPGHGPQLFRSGARSERGLPDAAAAKAYRASMLEMELAARLGLRPDWQPPAPAESVIGTQQEGVVYTRLM